MTILALKQRPRSLTDGSSFRFLPFPLAESVPTVPSGAAQSHG